MYKGFILMGVVSMLVIAGCKKLPDTSDENFIQSCTKQCMSQGMSFDAEKSLSTEPNTCICFTASDRAPA